jgi:flagellar basal-body rod modification protein FlgD
MSTSAISATGGTQGAGTAAGNLNVTGQQFLQLLVAQLKYQNPMQPLDSSQFLGQLATLEQVQLLEGIQADLDRLVQAQGTATPTQGQTPAAGGGSG